MTRKDFKIVAKILAAIPDPHALALAENVAVHELGKTNPRFDANRFRAFVRKLENERCPNPGCHCGSCATA